MKENKFGSLAMLEERLTDIVELYKDGKIDAMQFNALKHQEFDFAHFRSQEDIKFAYMDGFIDNNFNTYDKEDELYNKSYKDAELYYKGKFENK
jgi:hypothetical protein